VWEKINKTKKLNVELRSSISILENDPILDNITIYFNDNKISNLVKYQFVISNNGKVPIVEEDIKTSPKIQFNNSSKIIAQNIKSKSYDELEFNLIADSLKNCLFINFPLLNPKDFVEFVVYVSDCNDCKPNISARITGISYLSIEDETVVEVETKKSLGVFEYVTGVFGIVCLIFFFLMLREALQHSKIRKLIRQSPEIIDSKNSVEALNEFVASNLYFLTNDEKKDIENTLANKRLALEDRISKGKIKIKRYIQETGGSQVVFYASIIILIVVIILLYFRLR
jgi:hypothetical protein